MAAFPLLSTAANETHPAGSVQRSTSSRILFHAVTNQMFRGSHAAGLEGKGSLLLSLSRSLQKTTYQEDEREHDYNTERVVSRKTKLSL